MKPGGWREVKRDPSGRAAARCSSAEGVAAGLNELILPHSRQVRTGAATARRGVATVPP